MNSQSAGSSGLPYSAITAAPPNKGNRRMSSSGWRHTRAPKSSGYWVSMTPISKPPALAPIAPRCLAVVTPRSMRSAATAAKSSATLCLPSRMD